jgi:fatty acid desaturase
VLLIHPLVLGSGRRLFPTIPRNKLKAAQHIVKAFCQERSIPYHETGFLQSYREIFQHLHQVSAPLRRGS